MAGIAANVLLLAEVGDYEAENLNIKQMYNRSRNAHITTKPPILVRCCLSAGLHKILIKMAAKRKYARMGEKSVRNECTNKKCKWQGTDEEKAKKRIDEYMTEDICPKCGNNEFYGLLY